MAKKIIGYVKLQIPAGKANPSPLVSPVLGQRDLNIIEFCEVFNATTQGMEPGLPIPVMITTFASRLSTFVMKTPPASTLLKKVADLQKGNSNPLINKMGKLIRAQLEGTAKIKEPDLTTADLDAAVHTIAGSVRSMGLDVEGVV